MNRNEPTASINQERNSNETTVFVDVVKIRKHNLFIYLFLYKLSIRARTAQVCSSVMQHYTPVLCVCMRACVHVCVCVF